jgi:hypothetical protein
VDPGVDRLCRPVEAIRALVENRFDCLAIGSFWVGGPTD